MNSETGHLVGDVKDLYDDLRYRRVPKHLQKEAKEKLKGRREAVVDLKGKSGLARWARDGRKKNKTYANYLKNQQLRRQLRRTGQTGIKIHNGDVVKKKEG